MGAPAASRHPLNPNPCAPELVLNLDGQHSLIVSFKKYGFSLNTYSVAKY